jgi:hypothetical protein
LCRVRLFVSVHSRPCAAQLRKRREFFNDFTTFVFPISAPPKPTAVLSNRPHSGQLGQDRLSRNEMQNRGTRFATFVSMNASQTGELPC